MNWQELIDKYSKIYEMLKKHIKSSHRDCLDVCCEEGELYIINARGDYIFQDRELYDFFDEQGIKIFIEKWIGLQFMPAVYPDSYSKPIRNKRGYATRTEAEEQAFLRAFEILEEKLKEGR